MIRTQQIAIRKALVRDITKLMDNLKGIVLFGSIVGGDFSPKSDVDIILLTSRMPKADDLMQLRRYQSTFWKQYGHPLSVHVFDAPMIRGMHIGRNAFRLFSVRRNSELLWGQNLMPDVNLSRVRFALWEEFWEAKRLFLYNLANSNPSGRMFQSDEARSFSRIKDKQRWLLWFIIVNHSKMLRAIIRTALSLGMKDLRRIEGWLIGLCTRNKRFVAAGELMKELGLLHQCFRITQHVLDQSCMRR